MFFVSEHSCVNPLDIMWLCVQDFHTRVMPFRQTHPEVCCNLQHFVVFIISCIFIIIHLISLNTTGTSRTFGLVSLTSVILYVQMIIGFFLRQIIYFCRSGLRCKIFPSFFLHEMNFDSLQFSRRLQSGESLTYPAGDKTHGTSRRRHE